MKNFTTFLPTEVSFGNGAIAKLPELVLRYGNRALMVTTPWEGKQAEAFAKIKADLEANGIYVVVHPEVVPNPTSALINAGVAKVKEENLQVMIGVGGGSSIDSAKAIAVGATHPGEAWDYVYTNGGPVDAEKVLPIIAVTTTSGTGSHVTKYAVFTNRDLEIKSTIVNPAVFPKCAIVDPELMTTLPEHQTASTGFDAFSHAFESYTNINANPLIDMVALHAIELIVENLPKAMADPENLEYRSNMALADTLAGISIANVGTTLPHSIGQPISGRFPSVTHGESLAVIYPQFLEFTYRNSVEKFAKVARMFDPALKEQDDLTAAAALSGCFKAFLQKIGMYTSLEALGVTDDKLPGVIRDAMDCPDTYVNPAVPTAEQVAQMLDSAKKI